jgi:hypothetical protein
MGVIDALHKIRGSKKRLNHNILEAELPSAKASVLAVIVVLPKFFPLKILKICGSAVTKAFASGGTGASGAILTIVGSPITTSPNDAPVTRMLPTLFLRISKTTFGTMLGLVKKFGPGRIRGPLTATEALATFNRKG